MIVEHIYVKSFSLNCLDIFWQLSSSGEDPLDYDIYILRAESYNGPYVRIAGPIQDTNKFKDTNVDLRLEPSNYHYRLELYHRVKNVSTQFPEIGGVSQTAQIPLDGLEIARLEAMLFKEKIGRRAILLPIRQHGRRCPVCWDNLQQRRVLDNCITCFNTSYVGGYWHPMEIFIQIDPVARATQLTSSMGELKNSATSARLGNYPPVNIGDIIVENENRRWRVLRVAMTERLRAVVHQELSILELDRQTIEYKFPLDILENPSPYREFTNPMSPGQKTDYVSMYAEL